MKSVAMIVVSTLMWTVTLLIIMTVSGRMNRSVELGSGLSSIVEETLANINVDKVYDINSADEFIADFTECLAVQLDSDSDIQVDVMGKDMEKGLLSLQVTEKFRHPNGKPGTVTDERLVLFNRLEETEPQEYSVQFIVEGDLYKAYTVHEGDVIAVPVNPAREGLRFLGWKDGNGYLADFTQPVEQDQSYYAEWE